MKKLEYWQIMDFKSLKEVDFKTRQLMENFVYKINNNMNSYYEKYSKEKNIDKSKLILSVVDLIGCSKKDFEKLERAFYNLIEE